MVSGLCVILKAEVSPSWEQCQKCQLSAVLPEQGGSEEGSGVMCHFKGVCGGVANRANRREARGGAAVCGEGRSGAWR